jgi:hypothetical protein
MILLALLGLALHIAAGGLIWAEVRLRLDRLPQRRHVDFSSHAGGIPETRKSPTRRPPLPLRPPSDAVRSPLGF